MRDIINFDESDLEFKHSLEHITEHVINKNFYYRRAYSVTTNSNLQENFENQNQHRSYYLESNFNNCNLNGTGFTDSIFKDTTFNNCLMNHSNFESSYFFNCYFQNNQPYVSMSFGKSSIYNTTFHQILFDRCRMSDVLFNNSTIEGCNFDNTSFEGTAFNNTVIDGVSFKNLNLECTQFNNVHINNTALPFPTIPYIINGIRYLKNTSDNVFIKSAKKGKITKEEYLDLLPYLKTFYEKTNDYFPLSNIYIAEYNVEKAFETIKDGMYKAIFLNNYKLLKNYCILVSSCDLFNIHQKKSLGKLISQEFNNRLMDNFNFYSNMVSHFTELNNILLSNNSSSLIVYFTTNIKNNNYSVLSQFYKTVDLLISIVGIESNYSVNFTYNSNAEIITTINSIHPSVIVALISAFTTIFISGIKGMAHLPDVIKKFVTIKKEIQKDKYELKKIQLENKKTQLEIAKLEKEVELNSIKTDPIEQLMSGIEPVLRNCDKLNNAGVCVHDINYNVINLDDSILTAYTSDLIFNNKKVNN